MCVCVCVCVFLHASFFYCFPQTKKQDALLGMVRLTFFRSDGYKEVLSSLKTHFKIEGHAFLINNNDEEVLAENFNVGLYVSQRAYVGQTRIYVATSNK